jgi:lysozyme
MNNLPEDIQHVLANMCFQLGRPRLSKFKNLIAAVEDLDWAKMADEMEDSNWYRQTTNRAVRLIARVEKELVKELPL